HEDCNAGPWPANRGALVLSAADDESPAGETYGFDHKFHGAFSWAWFRALSDGGADEPAADTFLRARARLQLERPTQEPVIAGTDQSKSTPFLDVRADRRQGRTVVAVARLDDDGSVALQGGWINGLQKG